MRISDRDDELSDPQSLCVAEFRRHEIARVDPQHGEVGERVGTDDFEFELAPVDEGGAPAAFGSRDDVCGRQREAVGRDHDAAASAVEDTTAPDAARHAQVGERNDEILRATIEAGTAWCPLGLNQHLDPVIAQDRRPNPRPVAGSILGELA